MAGTLAPQEMNQGVKVEKFPGKRGERREERANAEDETLSLPDQIHFEKKVNGKGFEGSQEGSGRREKLPSDAGGETE